VKLIPLIPGLGEGFGQTHTSTDGWTGVHTALGSLNLSQSYYDNWTRGGTDALTWELRLDGSVRDKQEHYEWETRGRVLFGQSRMQGLGTRKVSDESMLETIERHKDRTIADHILPMVYPSHYFPTHLRNVPRPNRMPYETVFTSVGIGMVRWQRLKEAGVTPARVIPWLQAFNAPWVDRGNPFPYGPQQFR
jgi:hypothetical protein